MIADRYSKRAILSWCTFALLTTSAWIGAAIVLGWIAYWMLVVASSIQAAAFAYGPARMALTADLVDKESLNNAIVLGRMSMESTRIAGPAAAGVLISVARFGAGAVLLAGAALCAVSIALTLRLPRPRSRTSGMTPSALSEGRRRSRHRARQGTLRLGPP